MQMSSVGTELRTEDWKMDGIGNGKLSKLAVLGLLTRGHGMGSRGLCAVRGLDSSRLALKAMEALEEQIFMHHTRKVKMYSYAMPVSFFMSVNVRGQVQSTTSMEFNLTYREPVIQK